MSQEPELNDWPDNEFTRELRTWPGKFADEPDVECPTQEILDKAAALSDTVPSGFRVVSDGNGGVVFEADHGQYRVWDDGEVEWLVIRYGRVVERRAIKFGKRMNQLNDADRKTVAVCTRMLPIGEKDTAVMIVDDATTVGQLNAWCDRLCEGNTVCVRLELVDQWRG